MTVLRLERDDLRDDATLGTFVNETGDVECQTLEPSKTHPVPGRRCLPPDTYLVYLRFSPERGHAIYGYEDTHGFSDVEIHSGNDELDTRACTIVGTERGTLSGMHAVLNSRVALDAFMTARGCPNYTALTSVTAVEAFVASHPAAAAFTVIITEP